MVKIVLPIEGMHCRACEVTIAEQLEKVDRVTSASVSLSSKTATIEATSPPSHAALLRAVQAAGYTIGDKKRPLISHNPVDYKDLFIGIVVIGILSLVYVGFDLGKALPLGSVSSGGVGVALLTGLVAGLSTCMALIGGLILGLSARHASKHPTATTMQKFRPHLFFNLSRIISFFVFGGIIGALGASIQLKGVMLGLLTIVVGLVMFSMGLQLTSIFPRLTNGKLSLPPAVAKFLGLKKRVEKEYSHGNAMALGILSFFLPCGFTQVMQLYAISTGSLVTGSLIMGLFAIGTAPGLLGIGGLTSVMRRQATGRFFKIAGVAVMVMALINVSNGYSLTGFQLPSLSSSVSDPVSQSSGTVLKTIYTTKDDITPSTFTVNKDSTYTLEVDSKDDGSGCMSTIMIPGMFETPLLLVKGKKQILTFTPTKTGSFQITCAMGIPRGIIRVI
ncbi:MAG: sulfite exporter TauE/SafE family protein [Candidatus Saccharibacteria bacterium]